MQNQIPKMTRKCSHCNLNGHNSRTCPNRGVKLFGVRLTDGLIRKSASMGNLSHYSGAHLSHNSDSPDHAAADADGYASEDFVPGSSSCGRERKKAGVPWTEEEHRMFLLGLQKLGKGDWRGISRNYVVSRTPTQVASHAQKYFIRQTNMSRRKRRSSLFDIVVDESIDALMESENTVPPSHPQAELESSTCPTLPTTVEEESESMDSSNSNDKDPSFTVLPQNSQACYPVLVPTYVSPSPFFPFSFPYWPAYNTEPSKKESHKVLRPTAVHSKSPIDVDELVGMSKLSLAEPNVKAGPSSLSLKLEDGSARNSAFHAQPTSQSSAINSSSNPIHAV